MQKNSIIKICLLIISFVIFLFSVIYVMICFAADDIPHTTYVERKIIDSDVNLYLKSKMWGVNGDHYWIALSLTDQKEIDSKDFVLYGMENIYYDTHRDSVWHLFLYNYRTTDIFVNDDTTFFMGDIQVSLKDTNNVENLKRFSIYDES